METKKKTRRKLSIDYKMMKKNLGLKFANSLDHFMTREKPKTKPIEKPFSLVPETEWDYRCDWGINNTRNAFSTADLRPTSVYDTRTLKTVRSSVSGPIVASGLDPGYTTGEGGCPLLWADTVSKELITECKIAFSYFDKNCTGRVTWKDFGKILRNLGQNPTEKEIEDVRVDRILQSGTNGTGPIDFPEFITIIAKRFGIDGADEMESAFRAFDRNGDGLISFNEFKSYNEKIGQFLSDEEINEIMREVDLDGDGYLNYEEFLKMNR